MCFPLLIVDHINRNPLDNRRCNLRLVSHRENTLNRSKCVQPASSRFIGVSKTSRGKWASRIMLDGKITALGTYASEIEAARAYNVAAIQRSQEFASLNVLSDLET